MTPAESGKLYCIATPIGNLGDITLRAMDTLKELSHLACEDTRAAGRLLAALDLKGPRLISLFEHNEERRIGQILSLLRGGDDVGLISEAGTPTISDPGYRLVVACVEAGLDVVPIPGACAVTTALCASGLPTDRFVFLGFPARKGSKLKRYLERMTSPGRTAVGYLPARRLETMLQQLEELVPDARVVVARELTKKFEEFLRGTPRELLDQLDVKPARGECTICVHVPETRGKGPRQ